MYYTLKDHQGSLTATVHGSTVERLSYDPWGRRRNTSDFGYDNVSHTFDRGFTGHEHYDRIKAINANARLYDPAIFAFVRGFTLWQSSSSCRTLSSVSPDGSGNRNPRS